MRRVQSMVGIAGILFACGVLLWAGASSVQAQSCECTGACFDYIGAWETAAFQLASGQDALAPQGADGIAILIVDAIEADEAGDIATFERLQCTIYRIASRGVRAMIPIKAGDLDADLRGRPMTEIVERINCIFFGGSNCH